MKALKITATGWLQKIDVDPAHLAAEIGGTHVQSQDLRHNIALWFDTTHACVWREPNMSAVSLLLTVAGHAPESVPIPCGDIILLGVGPDGKPADLQRPQYEALAYTLLNSLAA
ncbi:MAG: hypothetical protein O2892_07690 [Actinomycetota bacterium]|nr:hypothetical protein [Actinomycetota bacterium]MDA2948911.1 hypothetical protein [Actinomycetota bacterium]